MILCSQWEIQYQFRLGNRLQMEQTAAVGNGPYSNNHGEVQRGGRLKGAGIISISQDTVVYLERFGESASEAIAQL